MEKTNYSVLDVAEYILEKKGPMTTMKLQKLLYYCQGWSLAWDDVPLFNEDFQAWANGPVCVELYDRHKGKFTINKNELSYARKQFDSSAQETIDIVLNDLGDKEPAWLSELTHSEAPWKDARKGVRPGERSNKIISKESMHEYYGGLI